MKAPAAVLDSSVVIAIGKGEAGIKPALSIFRDGAISAVNLAECIGKFAELNWADQDREEFLKAIRLDIVRFGRDHALETGRLRPLTRHLGLSLGDRACLATAKVLGVPAVTADRSWASLNLGIDIKVIR